MNLGKLATLDDGASATWSIKDESNVVGKELTSLIKAVTDTVSSDKVNPHGVHNDDWSIVLASNIKNYKFDS